MYTVGRNKKVKEEYIKNQLQEDIACDQISFNEYVDPFTGVGKKGQPLKRLSEKTMRLADRSVGLQSPASIKSF